MSEEVYTPNTGKVRTAYLHGVGGSTWYEGKAEMLLKQFDRWLFEMQEDAWDRGYQAGVVDGSDISVFQPTAEISELLNKGENSE